MLEPLQWDNGKVCFLDQTKLPGEEIYRETDDYRVIAEGIRTLQIRGAPLIGISAAYGICLGAREYITIPETSFALKMHEIDAILRATRPTAVNLFWALNIMKQVWQKGLKEGCPPREISLRLDEESDALTKREYNVNYNISRRGAALLDNGDTVLTHCNAGSLACGGWGTALGIIHWAALKEKKRIQVIADETRPLLQGSRLTAFELVHNDIPVKVICDNMAGYCMSQGMVSKVIVGADRVTVRGDVANKIGTYTVAVLASYHHIPFYVAVPLSSIDFRLEEGEDIPIEERAAQEVLHFNGKSIAAPGAGALNPAFDVTPRTMVTALITERGIITPPFEDTLKHLK